MMTWFTTSSKTLHSGGSALVAVTELVWRALQYFQERLRPLIVDAFPRLCKLVLYASHAYRVAILVCSLTTPLISARFRTYLTLDRRGPV